MATEALGAQHVTGVAMPGPYSSAHSLTDARLLAKNLGIDLLEYPITEPFYSMLGSIGQAKGDVKQDLAEQNLQARLRGQLLMTLSNRNQALVLATGNKRTGRWLQHHVRRQLRCPGPDWRSAEN
ncbi:MAG: hypothetical protein R2857_01500 [Vampirovibrionales bacterium]